MPEHKDVMGAFLGAGSALAGLLLVFIGFVYARGESYESRRGDVFKKAARLGIIPFLSDMVSCGFASAWLLGCWWAYGWTVWTFLIGLVLTALYGTVTLLFVL